jgi:hypothetical protein
MWREEILKQGRKLQIEIYTKKDLFLARVHANYLPPTSLAGFR